MTMMVNKCHQHQNIDRTDILAGTVADKYNYYFHNFINFIAPLIDHVR